MIISRADYIEYLERDRNALGISRTKPRVFGDGVWKLQRRLRRLEYLQNTTNGNIISKLLIQIAKFRLHVIEDKYGVEIPINVFDKGLCIVHPHAIVVSKHAQIGKNCRLHECVTIGASNKEINAATIGNNVFIAPGTRIIGKIKIADNVGIAPNTVVVKDVLKSGITIGGIPAVEISQKGSDVNMPFL